MAKNKPQENDYKLDEDELTGLGASELAPPEQAEEAPKKPPELPFVVKLVSPIQLTEKVTLTELVFSNQITASMLEHLPVDEKGFKLKMGHFFPIIGGMTGQPLVVVRKLSSPDLNKAMDVVSLFM